MNNDLDLIFIIKKFKKVFIISFFVVLLLSTIVAFLLPVHYLSYTTIKPNENSSVNLFASALGSKSLSGLSKLNIGGAQYSELDYYSTLITSRDNILKLIDENNLHAYYGNDYKFQTIKDFISDLDIKNDPKSNTLTIGYYNKDSIVAEKIVKRMLSILDSNILALNKPLQRYDYNLIENKVKETKYKIDSCEKILQVYVKENEVFSPESQMKFYFEKLGRLEAQTTIVDIELKTNAELYSTESPIMKKLQLQREMLRQNIQDFVKGSGQSYGPSISTLSQKAVIYLSLIKELEIQYKILEYVFPIYQQLQIEQGRNQSAFSIIEKAFVPEYKAKPKRLYIIIGTLIFYTISFVSGVLVFSKIKNNEINY